MAIGIYGVRFDENHRDSLEQFTRALGQSGKDLRVHESFMPFLMEKLPELSSLRTFTDIDSFPEMNLLLSVGGDGTLLNTVRIVKDSGIPVLGINTGRLGFLSLFSLEDPEALVSFIVEGGFELDPRTLLEVHCPDIELGSFPYALNEVTLHKKDTSSMITVHVFADGHFLNSYWADGLIASTPTGSTAYSLSCGGPIVMPGSENFILTPIAPHNLNVRPFVIANHTTLRMQAEGREPSTLLTMDNRSYSVPSMAEITLKKAPFPLNLVHGHGQHFFSTIRNKMMWGIDKRN